LGIVLVASQIADSQFAELLFCKYVPNFAFERDYRTGKKEFLKLSTQLILKNMYGID
jgi:hypothetical protein